MNKPQIFNFNKAHVRIVKKDGQPWFVLNDVCAALDDLSPRVVRQRLAEDVCSTYPLQTAGGLQNMTFINEDGLYDVILESRKPEARAFRKWITSEVLPTIRKTGSYTMDKPKSQAELLLMYAKSFVEMEQRVERMESTVTAIQETFTQRDEDWRNFVNGLLNGAAYRNGSAYRDLRTESYRILEERGHCDLNTRLRNLKNRMQESGATKTAVEGANKMDVIESDPRLKEIYTTVVKEISIGTISTRG